MAVPTGREPLGFPQRHSPQATRVPLTPQQGLTHLRCLMIGHQHRQQGQLLPAASLFLFFSQAQLLIQRITRLTTPQANIIRALYCQRSTVNDQLPARLSFVLLPLPTAWTASPSPFIASLIGRNPFGHPLQLRLARHRVRLFFNPKDPSPSCRDGDGGKRDFQSFRYCFLAASHRSLLLPYAYT